MIHHLKTWPTFFKMTAENKKNFEVREDDRGFLIGDSLLLEEWDPISKVYSGAVIQVKVISIIYPESFPPIPGLILGDNVVFMGIEKEERGQKWPTLKTPRENLTDQSFTPLFF